MIHGTSEIDLPLWRRFWLHIVAWVVLAFLIAPILIVIPMSFSASEYLDFPPRQLSLRWYLNFFQSVEWMDAAWVSLRVGLATVLLATPIGVAAAYGLASLKGFAVQIVRALLIVPMIIPVIIIAIGVFYLYAAIGLINTLTGLILAHTVLAIPFVVIIVTAGLSSCDMTLERAAISLGANRFVAFMTVTLPLIRRSVFAAALVAFITSLDEIVVALFVSSGEKSTLSRRMFSFLRDQIDPTIAAISTLLVAVSVLVVVVLARQSRATAR
jgi:putative spermidine/putrescine transport system permease protein